MNAPAALLLLFLQAQPSRTLPEVLEAVRTRTGIPGIAAAVVRDGKIVASSAAGVREDGNPDPVTLRDRWLVGSCTKSMTRLLLARLVERGVLRFDMTLAEAFPGVPMQEAYRKATIVDLARHTAGLPPYTRIGPRMTPFIFTLGGSPAERRAAFAAHVLEEPPAAEPGRFLYSNAGFALLGALIERKAGRPYEELMASEVFGPLGMTSAVIGLDAARAIGPVPVGHEHEGSRYRVEPGGPPVSGLFAPAGGVVLSIEDFARFAIAEAALEAGKASPVVGAATAARVPSILPADASPGEGAVLLGGQGTYTAGFAVWPSSQVGVVVATNGGDSDEVVEGAVDALRSAYAPELPAPPRRPPHGPPLGVMIHPGDEGELVVDGVAPGSPAERAGLAKDDRITAVDGRPVKGMDRDGLMAALRKPGARLSVLRGGKTVEVALPP